MVEIDAYFHQEIIKTSKSITAPFDVKQLYNLKNKYEWIYNKIEIAFNELQERTKERLDTEKKELQYELERISDILLTPEEVSEFFSEKLYVRNHMYCVKIDIYNIETKKRLDVIDLEKLSTHAEGAYYSRLKTPSMILFTDEVFCCAILTKKGNINLVGGYTEDEIKYTLLKFFIELETSIPKLYPSSIIQINSIELHNMAVSTSLPLTKIDIYNATTMLENKGVSFRYLPDNHDILTIKPFHDKRKSIYVRIFPSGGAFSFGYKSKEEIIITMVFIASLLKQYIRKMKYTNNDLIEWRKKILMNWKLQESNKKKRRTKKLSNWKKLKQIPIESIQNDTPMD